MREFKYDVIELIHAVQERPCLWDKTSEIYKDRLERRAAWEQVFTLLEEKYEEMSSQEKRFTGLYILFDINFQIFTITPSVTIFYSVTETKKKQILDYSSAQMFAS